MKHDLIAGLDIGTTKTCCVIAEIGDSGELIVVGVGVNPSSGLKRGIVVDLDSTVQSIKEAVGKAEQQSGNTVSNVYVGVTGEHIASLNSSGRIAITHPSREINEDDVNRVLQASCVIVIPPDREILHAIPRSYSVDGHNGIRQPVGMSGSRLEVETHIVTGAHTFLQNVEKCVLRAGLAHANMVLEPIATAEAVVLPAEKNLGVCMVDIGGGTSDLAIFQSGEIFYSAVIPVGGNHVTSDIATLLRVNLEEAEKVKIEHGSATSEGVGENEGFPLTPIGSSERRTLRRRVLCEIVEARMQELFQFVQKEIVKSGCQNTVPAGMVLTGGGSLLRGTLGCSGDVLKMPVRLGKTAGIWGLADSVESPTFATSVGLVQYGMHRQMEQRRNLAAQGPLGGVSRFLSGIFNKLRTD